MAETADIAELITACVAWAHERNVQVDTDSLNLLLKARCKKPFQPDPRRWSRGDVDFVADDLLSGGGDFEPDALITSWLTWCDFLVETERLDTGSASPRDLRAAVEDVAESLRQPVDSATSPPMRAMIAAMIREGIDIDDTDAVRRWMRELVDTPDRLPEIFGAMADAEDEAAGSWEAFDAAASETISTLPRVRLPSTAEMAGAARKVAPLHAAKELALWVGGGRPLAEDRDELTADDAALAASELGITQGELEQLFDTAVDAGFLRLTYTHVLPGPALPDWPNGDDDAVLRVWFNGFETATTLRKAPIVPMLLQTRLFAEHSGAVPVEELEKSPKLFPGLVPDAAADSNPVMAALERLAAYGAIELAAHEARATSLGDYGVVERLRRNGQPVKVATDAAKMGAAELLSVLADMRAADIAALAADWFGSRGSLEGARELLTTCESPEAYVARCAAVKLVRDLGVPAIPVWRERLGHPTLGPWARRALSELGEDLPGLTDADRMLDFWMLLDRWGVLIEQGRPD